MIFPVLSQFDPETVHERTLSGIQFSSRSSGFLRLIHKLFAYDHPSLRTQAFGLDFSNPLGIAAGFDKNGVAFPFLATLGFSHADGGTIVPEPQSGRDRPRLFRLKEKRALVNRMGFNSQGKERIINNLDRSFSCWIAPGFNLFLNIGANKTSVDQGRAVEDYVGLASDKSLTRFAKALTINISSPNTARLRDLQGKEALTLLVDEVVEVVGGLIPVIVKFAPDLTFAELDDSLDVVFGKADGVVITNTTVDIPAEFKKWYPSNPPEGLSGQPLLNRSTQITNYVYRHTEGKLPIIGVGGVFNWADVVYKMLNGASLVQTYTGFVYEGPGMAGKINRQLVKFMQKEGVKEIGELVGRGV